MQHSRIDDADEGQFDDASEVEAVAGRVEEHSISNPREGGNYIDEDSYPLDGSEDEYEEELDSEDLLEEFAFDGNHVEDEDWEITERGECI